MNLPNLYVIIPCYNEEDVLPVTAPQFLDELKHLIQAGKVSVDSRILFVNDGSSDRTWELIRHLSEQEEHYLGISQSRNRGHQSTVLAGLMEALDYCDITISIDCDGQDDITKMEEMVDRYHEGYEVVYGVRSSRDSDTWFKKHTALAFYSLMNFLGTETVYNHADYRLISKKVLKEFADFEEVNLFLRGMMPLVGFKSTQVFYERNERIAGQSHYPLRKMLSLAVDGITSLSIKPLFLISELGTIVSFLGMVGIIWAVVEKLLGKTVSGWASIVCLILILNGIQLLSLGIIGNYIGKTYMESKHRPRFIISERTWEKN